MILKKHWYRILKASTFVACLFLSGQFCFASGLQISPIRIDFKNGQRISSFTVTNLKNSAIVLQSEVKKWRQKDSKNIYNKQNEVFIAPPIIKIKSGQSQIFRVALRSDLYGILEKPYRIFLQEVVSKITKSKAGLHFAMRIGLPVFIAPTKALAKDVKWSLKKVNQQIFIKAENLGNRHVQVTHLKIINPKNKQALVNKKVFHYLLAGKSYTWKLNSEKKAQQFLKEIKLTKLEVITNGRILQSELQIS